MPALFPSPPLPTRSVGTTDCGKRVQTVNSFCPNCAKLGQMEWFSERQISQCQSEPVIRDSLARGARAAIIDCQRQFNESRWNCPTFYGANLFGSFVATCKCTWSITPVQSPELSLPYLFLLVSLELCSC